MATFSFVGFFFICVSCIETVHSVSCEHGWTALKDEVCIKVFDELLSYDDARRFCVSQNTGLSVPSLVTVKDSAMQEMLVNYTKDIYEPMWLGGKYDAASAQFKWEDGDPLTYTNWAEGYPRNNSISDTCILQQSILSKMLTTNLEGKWVDAPCQRRNLVLCQQNIRWSLEDATREILKLRKRDSELRSELDRTKNDLLEMGTRVVPVGSIYVEHYNQPSPVSLWPMFQWKDVSESYAGLFFRVTGDDSEEWGQIQGECAPRISQVQYRERPQEPPIEGDIVTMPRSGWSEYGLIGWHFVNGGPYYENVRYHVDNCEVRPTNQAIRIWKRLA